MSGEDRGAAVGDDAPDGSAPLLELRGVGKQFSGVTVLEGVDLVLHAGEIHAVVGENGAGKSTLMKIVAGAHRPDAGELLVDGEPLQFRHPLHAQQHGIGIVYQELNLLPERTVAQNVFVGRETGRLWWVDNRRMERETRVLLERLGVDDVIRPGQRLGELSVAAQQMVEIAKALSQDVRLLILDEPTAALADAEADALFRTLHELADDGIGVLYVSHRLPEVFALSRTVTVLKDGKLVATQPTDALDARQVVALMVGRELDHYFPERAAAPTIDPEPVLVVHDGGNDRLDEIDLQLHPGEVVGVAGLAGSGRTELVRALFGADPFTRGTVELDGQQVMIGSPREAVELGLGCISEDRKDEGLVLNLSVTDNGLLPARAMPSRLLAERVGGEEPGDRLDEALRTVDLRSAVSISAVRHLSGGNQQKVVLAKWLVTDARVLLFDEPTRGIDVGARAGIHELIRRLADEERAVLMVSSDLPEVIGMSDRIIVMHDGRIAGELPAGSTETDVMHLATGSGRAVA